ncbi:hypothetical protein [Litorimonas sp.]|uniref:hypothetical protein n=1 Tax=Litorimonas sp. TaxID=1892381 RepID=UPI003A88D5B9
MRPAAAYAPAEVDLAGPGSDMAVVAALPPDLETADLVAMAELIAAVLVQTVVAGEVAADAAVALAADLGVVPASLAASA